MDKATTRQKQQKMGIGEQSALSALPAVVRDALGHWALPEILDRDIALYLLEDWPASLREEAWQGFLVAARRGPLMTLVHEDQPGRFTLDVALRQTLLAVWQSDKARQKEYHRLHQRLVEYYTARWEALNRSSAIGDLELRQPALSQVEQMVLLQQGLYHHFAYDPVSAFERFEQLFQQYEWSDAAPICQSLYNVAATYRDSLLPRHRFWLDFYQAKLAGVQARFLHRYERERSVQLQLAEKKGLEVLLERLAASQIHSDERVELEGWIHTQLGHLVLLRMPFRVGRISLDDPYMRSALYNFTQAAERFVRLGSLRDEITARNNIGLVYQQAGAPEKAIAEYEAAKARLTGEDPDQLYALAVLCFNLGSVKEDLAHRTHDANLEREAIRYYEQAAGIFELVRFNYGRGLALLSWGRYLVLQGNLVEAEKKLQEALEILAEVNAPEAEIARACLQQLRNRLDLQREEGTHKLEVHLDTEPWFALFVVGGTKIQYIVSQTLLRTIYEGEGYDLRAMQISPSFSPPLKKETGDEDPIKQARAAFRQGYFRKAAGWYGLAEVQAHAYNQTAKELMALSGQAVSWLYAGELQRGFEVAAHLLARARQQRDSNYQMQAVLWLTAGIAGIDLRNRWREIRPLLLEGLDVARKKGDTFYEVYHLMRLGDYAVRIGEEELGFAWLQEALNALPHANMEEQDFFRAEIYQALSEFMRNRDELAEALRYAEMSLGAAEEDGNPAFVAGARLALAKVQQALSQTDKALLLVDEVLDAAVRYGWMAHEQQAQQLRAELLIEEGHFQEARPAARRAWELAQEMHAKEAQVRALLSLGQALIALNEKDSARHTLSLARRLSQERDYEDHFRRAETLLAEGQIV